jgi:N-(2-amino-2-carboxyethyl)-L-glutamate synthase
VQRNATRTRVYVADRSILVTDEECVMGCRTLLSKEALLVGGSSGAVMMAVTKVLDEIAPRATCVMLLPDRGERYLDTIFSDAWVENLQHVPSDIR